MRVTCFALLVSICALRLDGITGQSRDEISKAIDIGLRELGTHTLRMAETLRSLNTVLTLRNPVFASRQRLIDDVAVDIKSTLDAIGGSVETGVEVSPDQIRQIGQALGVDVGPQQSKELQKILGVDVEKTVEITDEQIDRIVFVMGLRQASESQTEQLREFLSSLQDPMESRDIERIGSILGRSREAIDELTGRSLSEISDALSLPFEENIDTALDIAELLGRRKSQIDLAQINAVVDRLEDVRGDFVTETQIDAIREAFGAPPPEAAEKLEQDRKIADTLGKPLQISAARAQRIIDANDAAALQQELGLPVEALPAAPEAAEEAPADAEAAEERRRRRQTQSNLQQGGAGSSQSSTQIATGTGLGGALQVPGFGLRRPGFGGIGGGGVQTSQQVGGAFSNQRNTQVIGNGFGGIPGFGRPGFVGGVQNSQQIAGAGARQNNVQAGGSNQNNVQVGGSGSEQNSIQIG